MEKSDQVFKKFDLFYSKYNCRICRKKLRYKADEIVHLKLKHAKKVLKLILNIIFKCVIIK